MSELPHGFVSAGHAVLFEEIAAHDCDVCGQALAREGAGAPDDERFDGRGLIVWTRGNERRCQEPPLCPSCAAAIGVTALSRWEIEEEEG